MRRFPFAPIHVDMPDDPKVAGLSDGAFRLHVAGIAYCNKHLTDGLINGHEVPRRVRSFRKNSLTELVHHGLWRSVLEGEAYVIHDYLDWNPSRAEVEDRKQKSRDNGARGGRPGATQK